VQERIAARIEVTKEAGLDLLRVNLGEIDGRSRRGRGLAQVREEGIEFESKVAKACATGLLCHLNGLALLAHLNCAASN
jgi:hypothetical protein